MTGACDGVVLLKTPTADRTFVVFAGVLVWSVVLHGCGASPSTQAAVVLPLATADTPVKSHVGALSEADVVRLAKSQDSDVIAARREAAAEAARLPGVGLYPDPSLAWNREHVPGTGGEREDVFELTVPVDLSSRRATERRLALADAAFAHAQALGHQSEAVVRALRLYYQLIAETKRRDIMDRVAARLKEAARIIQRRRVEGTRSGYDESRIQVELELALSRLSQSDARVSVLTGRLARRLGIAEVGMRITADLQPNPTLVPTSSSKPASRSIKLLRSAAAQSRAATQSRSRLWVPTLDITGGFTLGRADGADTQSGYVAGVSVAVPIFDRGMALGAVARSSDRLAQARVRAAERSVQQRVESATRNLAAATREWKRFASAIQVRVQALERAADSSYREGRRSIVELLDARRVRTSVESRQLELSLTIKMAEVELRAARGEFE